MTMEFTAGVLLGMLLGAGITLWSQHVLQAVEKTPPYVDDKQQISDSEYL
jgi:hypothetical protein